jgi:exopolysaccharide biosynthesis protein
MRKAWILGFSLVPIAACQRPTTTPTAPTPIVSSITSKIENRPIWNANLHIIKIKPGNDYTIEPAIAAGVKPLSEYKSTSIIAINAGFFDPANQKTISHVTIANQSVAHPKSNDRLTQNPKLKPYLPQIFNRSEFRRYQCGRRFRYAITTHNTAIPEDCKLVDAIGGGPQLLPKLTVVEEAFFEASTGRDAIGYEQPNARSAIGLTAEGDILIIMVEQTQSSGGVGLKQLAEILKAEGAINALNLDGGTSSALMQNRSVIFGKRDEQGKAISRPVKSVILVKTQ